MLSTCRRLPGTDDSRARFRSEPPVNKSPEFAYGPSTVLFRRISLTVRNRKPPPVATCVVSIGERHLSRGGLAPDEGDHSLPKRFHEGRRVVLEGGLKEPQECHSCDEKKNRTAEHLFPIPIKNCKEDVDCYLFLLRTCLWR